MSVDVVIVAAKRTPMGSFQGQFAGVSATDLGATAIKACLDEVPQISGGDVDEVRMGCVLPAGLGQAPARQASLKAGLPVSVGCDTVNKMCGSGMKAVMLAYDQIKAGTANIMVAGGLESMTNAPFLLPKARGGMRMGHGEVLDHMYTDGLQDVTEGHLMGVFAERCAEKYGFTREAQDAFAIESVNRAIAATKDGLFADEIAPVTVKTRKGETTYSDDEQPLKADTSKIPKLRAAFKDGGTVTAANASSISDGASAVLMMSAAAAEEKGVRPLAKIVAHSTHSQEPAWFTTAPGPAIQKVLDQAGWSVGDVDLFEVNEAFANVAMVAIEDLKLDHAKVNINGGACALGHPVGSSGSRIIATLIHSLIRTGGVKGVAALCIGGGEGTAIALEII